MTSFSARHAGFFSFRTIGDGGSICIRKARVQSATDSREIEFEQRLLECDRSLLGTRFGVLILFFCQTGGAPRKVRRPPANRQKPLSGYPRTERECHPTAFHLRSLKNAIEQLGHLVNFRKSGWYIRLTSLPVARTLASDASRGEPLPAGSGKPSQNTRSFTVN